MMITLDFFVPNNKVDEMRGFLKYVITYRNIVGFEFSTKQIEMDTIHLTMTVNEEDCEIIEQMFSAWFENVA